MDDLDKATRLDPAGTLRWDTVLDDRWRIGPKMHGGYLVALLARAAIEAATTTGGRPAHVRPESVTATFLRAPDPGPALLTADLLRAGRGASQVRVRLEQKATRCVESAAILGPATAAPAGGEELVPPPVEVAPFDDCPRSPGDGGDGRGALPIMDVMDVRLDPASAGFLTGRPRGEGRLSGWVATGDGSPWDALGLLVALDVLPPATFDLGLTGWSPTMSFTAHVHADAAAGPLRATQWVDHAVGDRMHETCRLWDSAGRLVGQSNQLAAVRR